MNIKEYTSTTRIQAILWENDGTIKIDELDKWTEGMAEFERKDKNTIVIYNSRGYKNNYSVKAPCYIVKGKHEVLPVAVGCFNRSYQEVE